METPARPRLLPAVLLSLVMSWSTFGQTYTINTFAGGGLPVNIPGTSAGLGSPNSVAVDGAGNLFFPAQENVVLRLDATTGILTLVAGNGTPGFSGDNGPATSAQLYGPQGVAVDSAGNLYIADTGNNRIRKVTNGVITTVAGNGQPGFSGDNGPATSAQLSGPTGLAVDSAGNLYIGDTGNSRIREVSNGVITTVAGSGPCSRIFPPVSCNSGQLLAPMGVAVDSAGNLYIAESGESADTGNSRILQVSNGVITTVAGGGFSGLGDNGPATSATLYLPYGVAVDPAGNLYIAEYYRCLIRKVSNGVITTVAGGGPSLGDNGPATSAQLNFPEGVAVDSAGNLYIADSNNNRIRKVSISNGVITTLAGNGTQSFSGDNGPATGAQLAGPMAVAADPAGNLYIADYGNGRIRKVSNGVITTVAGNGPCSRTISPTSCYGGDNGLATSAQLYDPMGVAVDSAGNLYIADSGNHRIREVSNGVITTVAGGGFSGLGDNGPATSAALSAPMAVAVDSAGNLYIADSGNVRIRKVSNGVITTVAGNGTEGSSGDNGPATSAQLAYPWGVAVDSAGNLYIADSGNYRIRTVSNGVITTVAGNGTQGFSGDNGPATSAALSGPNGVAVDSAGNLYIADYYNNRIRKVSNGVITTVAGGGASFGDNGPATSAQLYEPWGVAVDSAGNLYIADSGNDRIRVLTPSGSSCSASVTPLSLFAAAAGGNLTVTIQTSPSCAWAIQSLPAWITFSGSVVGTGSGSVTLSVAANPSRPRTATVSIAGVAVTVNEAGVVGSLSITKMHTGNLAQGQTGATYTVTVWNWVGAAATSGTVTVTETVPAGLTLVSMAGTGWTCPAGGSSCTRSDGLAAGASYPAITVTVNVAANAQSQVTNQVSVSGGGSAAASASDPTTIIANVTAPLPTIKGVTNAASYATGAVSPGELVTIFGTNIGPATAAYATTDPSIGKLATTIGGVQVLFNGIAAPMIYASSTQVSAVVPYEMASVASPSVWIKYLGQTSNGYPLTSATTAPGLFTQNASGSGPGAILNQDNSVNGPGNPAAKGSIVQVYLTGEGQTSPPSVTGAITTANLPPPQVTPAPLLAVGVTINGQPALYVYAGEAPGLVAGMMQLNVQIPSNAQSGNLPILVSIGRNTSQNNVTVSVQ